MRIELVCSSRELFGSDRSAVRLAKLLAGLEHEVRIVVPRHRPDGGLARLAGDAGIPFDARPVAIASRRGIGGLHRPRRQRRPRALTIFNSAAVLTCAGDGRPRALVVREWLEPGWARHRALVAWHRRRADAAIAVSTGVADRWRRCGGSEVDLTVCPNWIEDEWMEVGGERSDGRAGILFAGRLSPWKGQQTLADAYELAFSTTGERPDLTFLGAEDRPSPFHRHAAELRARCDANEWHLLGLTPDPRPVYARAALVVVPSLHPEPFGNVILEGLASGAKVISFPGGGADDLAPHFPGALELVPREIPALAAALRRWWEAGGVAQSEAEHEHTRQTLRERYVSRALAPRWAEIVDRFAA